MIAAVCGQSREVLLHDAVVVVVLVGLEVALIAILTAMGITGAPAVAIVVAFALAERVAYVRWFKKKTT